jgi:hypothetical protein
VADSELASGDSRLTSGRTSGRRTSRDFLDAAGRRLSRDLGEAAASAGRRVSKDLSDAAASVQPRAQYRRGSAAIQHLGKKIRNNEATPSDIRTYKNLQALKSTGLVHVRSIVGLTVFATGGDEGYDPFVVSEMTKEIQAGFRRKTFGLLVLQTGLVNAAVWLARGPLGGSGELLQELEGWFCPGGSLADELADLRNATAALGANATAAGGDLHDLSTCDG